MERLSTQEKYRSRLKVVEGFRARLRGVSQDGLVHSDGEVLCHNCHQVARWIGGWLHVAPSGPGVDDRLVREIRGMLLSRHGVWAQEASNGS